MNGPRWLPYLLQGIGQALVILLFYVLVPHPSRLAIFVVVMVTVMAGSLIRQYLVERHDTRREHR